MASIEEPNNQDHPVTLFAHIAARFERIELSHWTAVVFAWFARYDGIGRCFFEDEEESPAHEVLHCISELEHGTTDDEVAHRHGLIAQLLEMGRRFPVFTRNYPWLIEQLPHR